MDKYNDILHQVYSLVGNKTTYLSDLRRAGNKMFHIRFKGVYPSDKIPTLNMLQPYCILNLDKSSEPGSHWIALCYDGDETVVYDSFGRDYKKIIKNLRYSGNGRIINTDDDPEQQIHQTDCGARCLAFIKYYDVYGKEAAMKI